MGHKRKRDQNSNTKRQNVEAKSPQQPVVERKTKKSKKVKQEPADIIDEAPPVQRERKKRGKKANNRVSVEIKEEQIEEPEETVEGLHENVAEEIEQHEQENSKTKKNNNVDEAMIFPTQDLSELFRRMELAIPENDTSVYSTRVEKLNWDDISFKNYTAEDCKSQWLLVQKKLRRYRLLSEVINSGKDWIQKPWTNFYGGQKTKRHPDMPRRPLSSFMLFYLHKRDKIRAENPGLEVTEISKIVTQMYKALPPSKREKYVKEAAEKHKVYKAEIEEFYRQHPEISASMERQGIHKNAEPGPKKPNTPFNLFYESQLKTIDRNAYVDKHKEFKEQCKEQWKNMSDKKKVIWINWSVDEETKYYDELKNYATQNPDFVVPTVKSVLTKDEKILKERMAGKPVKPPNSAYSLYSRIMLQSDEIKNITPKDRMVYIADKWKNCSEQEKKDYSERIGHLQVQYKLDFASYLESLPEEKRQEELRNTMPKRKRSPLKTEEPPAGRKKKIENDVAENSNNKVNKRVKEEKQLVKESLKKKMKKDTPFAKPPYWNRMKREEKRTFKNAMLKLKEHLDSRFEKYINNRDSATSGEEDESNESEESESVSEESS